MLYVKSVPLKSMKYKLVISLFIIFSHSPVFILLKSVHGTLPLLTVPFKSIAIHLFYVKSIVFIIITRFLFCRVFVDPTSKLCLKDLSKEVTEELTSRLNRNKLVLNRFYRSFGLNPDLLYDKRDRRGNIGNIFPDTPVKLLNEVFEALKLYDLAEFLEKAAKRRTLRRALPLKEIEKLSNAYRPIKIYSKVEVLIIEFCEASEPTPGNEAARRVGSFFKNLNSENEITSFASTIFSEKLSDDLENLIEHKSKKESDDRKAEEREADLKWFLERKMPDGWYKKKQLTERRERSVEMGWDKTKRLEATLPPTTDEQLLRMFRKQELAMRNELKELTEKREQWKNERKPWIEKQIKLKEEELKKEIDKFEMALSTVIDKWKELQANDEGWIKL